MQSSSVAMAAPQEVKLDRSAFNTAFKVAAVKVPTRRTSEVLKRLHGDALQLPKTRRVEPCPERDDMRLILLKEGSYGEDGGGLGKISDAAREFIMAEGLEVEPFTIRLGYAHCTFDHVLKQLLGPIVGMNEVGGSFETVGHLAHLNLKDPMLPYKKLIGEVLLEKNPTIKTVVNKVGTIETEFRTFPMELLAGEDCTMVEVRESGCTFRFDFAKVYWNSRLQTEHDRLIRKISSSGGPGKVVVCDMMAGVGPFAVPLAKRGYSVFANDLNPHSAESLAENARANHCAANVLSHNKCARQFVRELLAERKVFHHAIMNLPASAIDFLDVFQGVEWSAAGFLEPPMIHVYCFSKAEDPAADAIARVNSVLGSKLNAKDVAVHMVRDVAPKKAMMCLSFRAPAPATEVCAEVSGTAPASASAAAQEAARGSAEADAAAATISGGPAGSAATMQSEIKVNGGAQAAGDSQAAKRLKLAEDGPAG